MSLPIFLRIFSGSKLVAVKQFEGTQVIFGRDAQVDVDLSDDEISTVHSMIEIRDGEHYLCDLGSKTGTKLNGQTVLDKKIVSGDVLELGKFKIEFYIGIPKPKAKPAKTIMPDAPSIPSPDQIQHSVDKSLVDNSEKRETIDSKVGEEKEVPPVPKDNEAELISSSDEPVAPILPGLDEAPSALSMDSKEKKISEKSIKSNSELADLDSGGASIGKKGRRRLTYAPPSSYSSLDEVIKPGKGVLIDVMTAWGDRVLETTRITKDGQVSLGCHPKNDIILPALDGVIQSQVFMNGANSVSQVFVPKNKMGHLLLGQNQRLSFKEASDRGRATSSGNLWVIELRQDELIRIDYSKDISVFITHAQQAPPVIMGGLSTSEIMSIVGAIILAFLMYFISNSWVGTEIPEEEKPDRPIRVTKFEFKRNEKIPANRRVEITDKKQASPIKTPSKVETARKKKLQGDQGKAGELRKNKNRIAKPKVASEKKGKVSKNRTKRAGKKSTKKGSNAKARTPSPPDLGLQGLFAKQGVQNQLNKVVNGKNQLLGATSRVTGAGGGSAGGGSDSGLKNVSKGGKGEQTIGKQSVDTDSSGNGLGDLGEGDLGQKGTTSVDIGGEGTEFVGTIDREAVRRVIRANLAQVRACYEEELNKDLSLYGKVLVSWEIQAQGRVGRAFVKSSTLKNSIVEKCILRRLKTWRFPIPPAGATAGISYPFVFSAR